MADERVSRGEWYLATFTVLLLASALFVATAIPATLFGFVFLAALSGEACFAIRSLLLLRRPLAEVRVLSEARWR